MTSPSVIAFGPQSPWPDSGQASRVRESILHSDYLDIFRQSLKELPGFWENLVSSNKHLQQVPGVEAIRIIQQWFDQGSLENTFEDLPNVLITPLTVIIHIGLYFKYLKDYKTSHSQLLEELRGGIQGFCTGLLSAIALACSNNEDAVARNAAVALRLALCIGAYVDLDARYEPRKNDFICLAARWRSSSGGQQCSDIVNNCTGAYVSVVYDHNSITITAPESEKLTLLRNLSDAGVVVKQIDLRGRFHSTCHQDSAKKLIELCNNNIDLHFKTQESFFVPVHANSSGNKIETHSLSEVVIQSLLVKVADWYSTLNTAVAHNGNSQQHIVAISLSEAVPTSISQRHGIRVTKIDASSIKPEQPYHYPDDAVAVVGMACKYAGADSTEEFWDLIKNGISMVERLPQHKWSTSGARRMPAGSAPFWGNFVHDADAFDHKFFKSSSRQAAAMDPQQRLLLQAAYQAVESSGYFGDPSPSENVGCYIGVATNDYHDNIASHKTSAFSALGELRAFLCGRISYHFGWTGPSMTYDTACSASAVAIDAACKAIKSGTVSAALAGGVNVATSPYLWENLMAANFLSPTGQTKPFDAKGDGYCRGEGVGLVFLKKLSVAREDGDPILAVIAGSSVNQCKNETFITVPHGPSQSALYKQVLEQSKINLENITFVEAHGTGTQAGDPVEIESIRQVVGSATRKQTVHVGSVKGNIGHCEAASGVASLIKTMLMMEKGLIPPLASHTSLNNKIPALETHKMAIPNEALNWKSQFKAALVNNYGAAGSNGALVVCQAPQRGSQRRSAFRKVPILMSAFSQNSLVDISKALRRTVDSLSGNNSSDSLLVDFAFSLTDKYQHFPQNTISGTATSLSDIVNLLESSKPNCTAETKPVVLVFGGQTKDHVGLDRNIYEDISLFREHLDSANAAIRTAGLPEIFPAIFQTNTVEDVVNLHCMFFAIQYACAKSWIAAGLKPKVVIGHSFGQLTALCISGCIGLLDAVKLVSGRAVLMQKRWGSERGSMISLEATIETVSRIVEMVEASGSDLTAEIACYNGPTSHVLVGTDSSINCVENLLRDEVVKLGTIRYKRLKVTHGFHSVFTEPLLPELVEIAKTVTFKTPTIPLETCSKGSAWTDVIPERIAEHTRTAVYFSDAVERVAQRLGPCTWLEAGGDSSVTGMVRRVFNAESRTKHSYHAVRLTGGDALEQLAETTAELWKVGQVVKFWLFHRTQRKEYVPISLPPYQFEKTRHWLEWEDNTKAQPTEAPVQKKSLGEPQLLTLKSRNEEQAHFIIDPRCEEYQLLVKGHAVLDSPLCPADFYTAIAHQALVILLQGASAQDEFIYSFENLSFQSPLGINPENQITLVMTTLANDRKSWRFIFSSYNSSSKETFIQHMKGEVKVTPSHDARLTQEMSRYENLIGLLRPTTLLQEPEATGLHGPLVYQLFSRVVNYANYYHGVKRIASIGDEVAAQVVLPPQHDIVSRKSLSSAIAIDNFVQVAGIKVNCLNPHHSNQVYICSHIGRIQASREFNILTQSSWTVYAQSRPLGEKSYMNDIYVFGNNGKLSMIIESVNFTRVAIASLNKVLSFANTETKHSELKKQHLPSETTTPTVTQPSQLSLIVDGPTMFKDSRDVSTTLLQLKELISKVADVPLDYIKMESTFEDLGIDSLMSTEVYNAVQEEFGIRIPLEQFMDLQEIGTLSNYLSSCSSSTLNDLTYLSLTNSTTRITTPALSLPPGTDGSRSSVASISGDLPRDQLDTFSKLNALVAELLDVTDALSPETALHELGLDSLLSIELASAIESEFKCKLDSEELGDGITFSKLHECVVKGSDKRVGQALSMNPKPSNSFSTFQDVGPKAKRMPGDNMKTVCFKNADGVALLADIYTPEPQHITETKKPIAMMIHGGGYTMLSRKDIRPRQTQLLLANGFLPVSIDYRLCPEINIIDGAITDVCDALEWCRNKLPHMDLGVPGLQIDGDKIAVIGWSTGGTLSLTLGFTTLTRNIKPPDVILAFYCPSNYEDEFWKRPNFPENSKEIVPDRYDLLEGVNEVPITGYNVDPKKGAVGGWMSMSDPRSRIVLHMNWKGQALPVLLGGLPSKKGAAEDGDDGTRWLNLEQPSHEKVVSISPYSQIMRRNYRTPTFLIHSTEDDLVPLTQAQQTYEALLSTGVQSGMSVVEGVPHLFDLYRDHADGRCWRAVMDGYKFVHRQIWG